MYNRDIFYFGTSLYQLLNSEIFTDLYTFYSYKYDPFNDDNKMMTIISKSNWTKWSTIQGLIAQVIN